MVDHTHPKPRGTQRVHPIARFCRRLLPGGGARPAGVQADATQPQAMVRPALRGHVLRVCLFGLTTTIILAIIGFSALALLLFRLSQGPISIDTFSSRIEQELDGRIGSGYSFRFGQAAIERGRNGPGLTFAGLTLRDAQGRTIIAAPRAEVTISLLPLLIGRVSPTRLEIFELDVRLSVLADGSIAVSAGTEPFVLSGPRGGTGAAGVEPSTSPATAGPPNQLAAMRPLAEALRSVLDTAMEQNSVLGALKRVGISHGRLQFEDQTSGRSTTFAGLEFSFDKSRAGAHLGVSAEGPNGRWSIEASTTAGRGEGRSLDIAITDITSDEIALVSGMREPEFDFDMPVSVKLRFGLGPEGALGASGGTFHFGQGYFYLADPDHEPLLVDDITGAFHWDDVAQRVMLDKAEWRSGLTHIGIAGTATPPRSRAEPWLIDIASTPGSAFGPERPGDNTVAIERSSLSMRVLTSEQRLIVDRFEAYGPQLSLGATVDFNWSEAQRRLRLGMTIGKMPVHNVLQLWPSVVVAPVRGYLLDHLSAGVIEGRMALDFDGPTLAIVKQKQAAPDDALRMDFTIADATLLLLPGVPPMSGIDASGKVTGHTTIVTLARGVIDGLPGHRITLLDGTFQGLENDKKPAPATVSAHITGSMESVADILGRDGMKPHGGMQIDATVIKGQVDAQVGIELKLGPGVKPEDAIVHVASTVTNLSIDKLVGKEKLEQGTLAVNVDASGLRATGSGRLFGSPATLEMRKPPAGNTDATIAFQLDEAGRGRMGFNFGAGLNGLIGVRVAAPFGVKDVPPAPAQVELDFTRASLDDVLPGLVKPVGRPAKATFSLNTTPHGTVIDQLAFDATGGSMARGEVEFDPTGAFKAAHLSQLRLSPGDDMKLDAEQGRDALKLTVRAGTIDARPYLKGLFGGEGANDITASRDMDIDLHAGLVTGSNRQALGNVDLRVSRRAGGVQNFQLQAKSGKAQVIGLTTRSRDGEPVVSISTNEGGAFLSFFDLYKRMEGGKLQLAARMTPDGVDGSFRVNDFILRDEPALRRLVTEGVAARDDRGGIKIDTGAAVFSRMSAEFSRNNGQIFVKDGVMYGAQVGIKVDGMADFGRDRVDMTGTFVPAYGVNNLFSQIPLFGPILGGSHDEGLFAVNFHIGGAVSAPQLTINPLSAIAPGFLRKIFGAGGVGNNQYYAPPPGPMQITPAPMQITPQPMQITPQR